MQSMQSMQLAVSSATWFHVSELARAARQVSVTSTLSRTSLSSGKQMCYMRPPSTPCLSALLEFILAPDARSKRSMRGGTRACSSSGRGTWLGHPDRRGQERGSLAATLAK